MAEVKQGRVLLGVEDRTHANELQESLRIEEQLRQRTLECATPVEAQPVVDDRLPTRRQWRFEPEPSAVVGPVEARPTDLEAERHVECRSQGLRVQIDFGGQRLEPSVLLDTHLDLALARKGGTSAGGLDLLVEVLLDAVPGLSTEESALDGGVEHLAGRAEVLPDGMHLTNDVRQEGEVGVVVGREVEDSDIARLSVPVEASV